MINKIKLINVSIATCSYLVTESVSVSLYVCVCVCVCVCLLRTLRIYSQQIQVYDTVLLTTDTMIVLIEKIPRTYSSYE